MIIKTSSPEETENLGKKIGKSLKSGDLILLSGDMGSGKTHLVKGIAKSLGYDGYVTSPTFTIVNTYEGKDFKINHLDVYRVNDEEELLNIGIEEMIFGKDISIIEWANLIPSLIPNKYLDIKFTRISDNERKIEIDESKFHPLNEVLNNDDISMWYQ